MKAQGMKSLGAKSPGSKVQGAALDAVSLGILWDRVVSIADEIVTTLVRTSFSTIVREGYDLSVVMFDANGRMLAQGTRSIPVFIGTAPVTLAHMLRRFPPQTLAPGDVIATNDPMMGTGHMFDISVMRPVFAGERLVGYTMSVTHLPDVGGMGFSAAATEMFHEGLRLPICKLLEAGRPNEPLLELIRANVRVPEQVIGDIMANVACNEVGGRQLLEFMAEYGIDDLAPLSTAIRAQSERAVREKIRQIPDGTYGNTVEIEAIEKPVKLVCRIDKKGEEIAIDFAGTDPCIRAGINVPFCYAKAMALYSIKCITAPLIPNNEGSAAPITVTAPEGCILNAQPPAPTAGRHVVGHFVTPLIYGALAEIMPQQVQADTGMMNILTFQGTHPGGQPVAALYFAAGGFGALEGHDGAATTPGPSNMACVPTEIFEDLTGLMIERKALRPDSGGPGEYRGGPGQEIVIRNATGHRMAVFSMANRTEYAAMGRRSGRPGALRQHLINGQPVHPKGRQDLMPGDRLTLLEAGGAGIGDPLRRRPESVADDVRRGYVTPEGAARDYHVSVDKAPAPGGVAVAAR